MKYVISDLHLGHKNIMFHCNRPFTDVKVMDKTIIDNWNSVVKKNDEVYILGDICMKFNEYTKDLLDSLNGHIYLVKGNHDNFKGVDKNWLNKRFKWIKDYFELNHFYNNERIKIVMSHYPMVSWNKSFHGSIMLFGHCHGTYKPEGRRTTDVGVDTELSKFFPIDLDDILETLLQINHRYEETS